MIKKIWFLFIANLCCAQAIVIGNTSQWVKVYHKIFSSMPLVNRKEKVLKFSKKNVEPFSQLLFSWNAFRPEVGYFSFWIQSRNKKTKNWGEWYKMIEWGSKVQRSYASNDNGFSHYAHVRLEIKKNILADAFNMRIIAHDGADVSLLHSIFVTLANFNFFRPEKNITQLNQLTSVYIKGVPRIAQFGINHAHNNRICSPVSCTMLTCFLNNCCINPLDFAYQVFDDGLDTYGSWPFNMAHAFECCNSSNFFATRLNSFVELHRQLKKGIPVVVSVRGQLKGAPKDYSQGHLLVVIGWNKDKKQVVCHDPAFKSKRHVLCYYTLESFIQAWERSHRLTYWAEPILK